MPTKFELFVMANNMAAMVNDERKALGLRELYVVPYLQECAEIRAEEASVSFSHTRPNGKYCSTVIDYDKFEYGYFAENLACGSATVYETFSQWRNSEKHWSAITNKNITHMGIGVTYDPDSENKWYWSQIFTNDIKGEVEHEGQYISERIELNNKISVLVTDEDGNTIKDANIKISEFSSGPDTLQNIKVGKNGEISTERTYTSSSSNRTMLVKSTAEPVIFYDLETGNTYTLQAEKSGFKYVSGAAAGFHFNSNGKIIDSVFDNNYDGNFVIKMRPIKLTIKSTEGLTLEIHTPENSVFDDIQGNVDFVISDDKKVLTYMVGSTNAVFTGFPAGEYKIYFPMMPDGYYVKNGYMTQKILGTDDATWNIYPSQRNIIIQTYGINDNSEQIQVSGAEFELTFLGDGTFYEKTTCNGLNAEITGNSIKFIVSTSARVSVIPAGDYQLTELTPPDGYEKVQTIYFTLGDGEITNLQNAVLSGNTGIKIIHSAFTGAFENAEKLRKIVIPESVKKIGTRSFSGTDLKSVKISSDCEYSESSFPEGCKIEFYSD